MSLQSAQRRRWLFRLSAVLLSVLPLLLLELFLRFSGLPPEDELLDPWIGFESIEPLFEKQPEQLFYRTAASRRAYFEEARFAEKKTDGGFRVFCLGGSTVQGRPYQPATAFSSWLKLSLQAAEPDRHWEVVNCGGISYASYRLLPILEEILNYDPDLVILYTGHNEFLENRTYATMREPGWLDRLGQATVSRLRVAQLLRHGWLRLGERLDRTAEVLPSEVAARLDREGGLDDYQRDDDWQRRVAAHFQLNVSRMIRLAEDAGVPLILVNPVDDLRDTPPFKSVFDSSLTTAERAVCERLLATARASSEDMTNSMRIESLRRLLSIDPRRADAIYLLGRLLQSEGKLGEAARQLSLARDEDVCPLRMTTTLHQRLLRISEQTGTPLVDARLGFEQKTGSQIVGHPAMMDHVHPSVEGHQWIAGWLFEKMVEMKLVHTSKGWEARRKDLYRNQLAGLDAAYFERGKRRLEGLRMWTRGLAGRMDLLLDSDRQENQSKLQ